MFNLEKEFILPDGNGMLCNRVLQDLHLRVTRLHNESQVRSERNEQRIQEAKRGLSRRESRREVELLNGEFSLLKRI